MKTVNFLKRKHAFERCVDDTLSVFLARQNGDPEYLDDEMLAEAHEQAWELLEEDQRQQIWGLSSDLYSLSNNEKISQPDQKADDQSLVTLINDSYEKQDWNQLLSCFRSRPDFVDKETIAYMRGRAWEELGFPRVSLAFYDNASRLEPAKPTYRYLAMNQLKKLGDWDEVRQRCEMNASELANDATMQLLVGELYHDVALNRPESSLDKVALKHLDRGFELEREPDQTVRQSVLGSAVASKVFVLTNLDRVDDSLPFLNSWIDRMPENSDLLATRGLVYLTRDHAKAVEDFEGAIRLGTTFAIPYLEVARNKLRQGSYEETKRTCRIGVQLAQRDAELAEFHHLIGLAAFYMEDERQAGLEFRRAATLAPFNRTIHANERLLAEASRDFLLPQETLRSNAEIAELMSTHSFLSTSAAQP